jgi:predicted dehydrogenase
MVGGYDSAVVGVRLTTLFVVLVDKPVTSTAEEAKELGELAKSKNLVLYPFQNRRWDSDFMALRRLLSQPPQATQSLGDLVEFESQ